MRPSAPAPVKERCKDHQRTDDNASANRSAESAEQSVNREGQPSNHRVHLKRLDELIGDDDRNDDRDDHCEKRDKSIDHATALLAPQTRDNRDGRQEYHKNEHRTRAEG